LQRSHSDWVTAVRHDPTHRLFGLLCASVVVASLGCGPKGSTQPGAQSPERQSDAEYDVALDLFGKGQNRVALDHIRKSIDLNEDNDRALYLASAIHLSFCAGDLGFSAPDCNLAEAERYARLALKAKDDFRDARNMLGQILINEKKYAEALGVLEPLTKDAAYAEPHLAWGNFGWAQVLSGQLDAGIASLKNSITNPKFCVGHYRLGVAFERKGDFAQAEASFTNAVSVDNPSCQTLQEAWEARARARMKLGKVADARTDYEKCRDISAATSTGKSCVKALSGSP
jgi:Tfp pilus assembly protein PilF